MSKVTIKKFKEAQAQAGDMLVLDFNGTVNYRIIVKGYGKFYVVDPENWNIGLERDYLEEILDNYEDELVRVIPSKSIELTEV